MTNGRVETEVGTMSADKTSFLILILLLILVVSCSFAAGVAVSKLLEIMHEGEQQIVSTRVTTCLKWSNGTETCSEETK